MMAVGRSMRWSMRRTSLDRGTVSQGVHDNNSRPGTGIPLLGIYILHAQFLYNIALFRPVLGFQIGLEVVACGHGSVASKF